MKQLRSTTSQVAEFLRQAAKTPLASAARGRLIFALDATASRQPTWDRACQLQGDMFAAAESLGGLALQLVWYRGYGEFQAEPWLVDSTELQRRMTAVHCRGGLTQIGRVLAHAIQETRRQRVNALVLVGDCMEESADALCHQAGQLGLLGVPVFAFQEGRDPAAMVTLREIARLTRGAYCAFDAGSARQLRELLSAVAVYAAGGRLALTEFGKGRGGLIQQLTQQL